MPIIRDSQRSRVYDAEDEYLVALGRQYIPELWELQRWVNQIIESTWWTARFPRVIVVQVKDGRRRRSACGSYIGGGTGRIKVPCAWRCKTIILDELAHVVTLSIDGVGAWHGELFVGDYLALVDRWMGQLEGLALRWFLSKNRLKWQELHRQADDEVVAEPEPVQLQAMYSFALALPMFGGFLAAAVIDPAYVLLALATATTYLLARSLGAAKWFARAVCWVVTLLILTM